MTAQALRDAAKVLRERANDVTAHSGGHLWFDADVDLRNAIRGTFLGNKKSAPDDARWIALMTPTVGLALADWLDTMAAIYEMGSTVAGLPQSTAVARAILGES